MGAIQSYCAQPPSETTVDHRNSDSKSPEKTLDSSNHDPENVPAADRRRRKRRSRWDQIPTDGEGGRKKSRWGKENEKEKEEEPKPVHTIDLTEGIELDPPPKLHKKLYIPLKEYPGFNFIGLIIGSRGEPRKTIEIETGAKIVIRGKVWTREDYIFRQKNEDDLHVLVEASTRDSLEAAAGMIEKILLMQPVDDVLNECIMKRELKEFATAYGTIGDEMYGTIGDEEFCKLCGDAGHGQLVGCPRLTTFKSDLMCKIRENVDCLVKKIPKSSAKSSLPTVAPTVAPLANAADHYNNITRGGLCPKDNDETTLYVGYLPPNFEDDNLISLFSPFGKIVMAKVVTEHASGLSKCYGFVKYADVQQANRAIARMNGYTLHERAISIEPPESMDPPATYPCHRRRP